MKDTLWVGCWLGGECFVAFVVGFHKFSDVVCEATNDDCFFQVLLLIMAQTRKLTWAGGGWFINLDFYQTFV